MKKNYSLLMAGAALASVALFLVWFFMIRTDRIGYVDASKLLSEYKGTMHARKQIEEKTTQVQANIDTLTYEIKQLIASYEEEVQGLSEKVRAERQWTISTKQQQLMQYQQAVNENMTQEDGRASQEVIGEINRFLKEYGEENHYKLILIASNVGTIAYAAESMDLTGEVLDALNKKYVPKKL